jgi:methionine sulfoxide reductase heme-binding subunit
MRFPPANLPASSLRWLKPAVFAACLIPLAELFWLGMGEGLGANPVEFVTRSTGRWTLIFLCITLTVTPLRRLTGWSWLLRLRRMLGLYAFFYACLHFSIFLVLDHFFDLVAIVADILKRPFVTVGFLGLVLMAPLAATSTNNMVKRLGAQRWQALHRLVYVIAVSGVVHYFWLVKKDITQPLIYGAIVAVLLLVRVLFARRDSRRTRGASAPAGAKHATGTG